MKFRRAGLKAAIVCALALLVALVPHPLLADETPDNAKVVRVGWYDSAFHHTDRLGRRSGYGYEYQMRIATYTGWTYEYVEGSWSELLEMLMAGDIDLLSDVSYTEERAEKILYSSEEMGSEDYHVFISPTNTEISPDDFSTLNGKRIGVNKNSIQEQLFIDWCKEHEVTPEIVESTEKTPRLFEMLTEGDFDALVTLDTYGNTADAVPVCKIGSASSFFGINKARPDLKQELDTAMNRIFEENRDYNQQMTERLHRGSSVNHFLTSDEIAWLQSHGTIRVGYHDRFMPFCSLNQETGELTGALADFLTFAETSEKNARLSFEAHPFSSMQDALKALSAGEIDCLFPVYMSPYDSEQHGVIISDPFVATEMYAMVRTEGHQGVSADKPMSVALIRGTPDYESFIHDSFPDWSIVYFDKVEDAFRAVATGKVDCTLVSSYRINRVSKSFSDYNLSALTTGQVIDISFAVRRTDDCLYSILNKVTRAYPDTLLNSSLSNYSFSDNKVTFEDFLKDNFVNFVAVVATVAVAILVLVLRNVYTAARAKEGRQIISETERDQLTGLYNWNFFLAYASRLHREDPKRPMDAVVMNIDRFHSINALHGRDFGDRVLRELGSEIQDFLEGTQGIASRFESDRFDIYCDHREGWQDQLMRFQSRLDALSRDASVHLRMGVKPWQEGMEPVQQFDCARAACNKVRGHYKSQVQVYDEEMGKREEREQRLSNDLTRAIENHELEVYYQPKYDIQAQEPRLSSAEALVRWRHPELGMISPAEFIPLFEQNGRISALDHFVWREAARQVAAWRDAYGVTIPVSVNLSRVDVFDASLFPILDGIVTDNGLTRADLKLEVTESAYTENAGQLIEVIKNLREQGYKIEMDDFGSGYSSLNMLSSMPVDVLKMDIGFVRNIEHDERDLHLVELILDIARYLKVPVIAEGVETEGQLRLLRDAGCNIVQGYYFSRPVPADEFEKTILAAALRD